MGLTLAEARMCFNGFLLSLYRDQLRQYETFTIQAAIAGAKDDPFEDSKKRVEERIELILYSDPNVPLDAKVIDDSTIRQQIFASGIPFSKQKKKDQSDG